MGNGKSKHEEHIDVFPIDENIKAQAYEVEARILQRSALKYGDEIYAEDVRINHYGDNYLHTLRAGREEHGIKEHIIMLHGYQGSSITFYRLFEKLFPKFNVYVPDHLGMALSSRPNVDFHSAEEWIDFFVESIEKLRQTLKIGKFYLVGHSLGGYIAANYALKYPENIKKLSLLSPAGITDLSKGGHIGENMDLGKKMGFGMLKHLWSKKPTVGDMYRQSGLVRFFLKKGLKKRYDVHKSDSELMALLTEFAYKYPPDLDKAIYYIFKPPIPNTNLPLESRLIEEVKDFDIDFFFGEKDWMDTVGSKRVCQANPDRFKYYTISKYGHNFNLENPDELSGFMVQYGEVVQESADVVKSEHEALEHGLPIEGEEQF